MEEPSALAAAVVKVGDRWLLLIIETLLQGERRFGELQTAVPGIATNVLSQRLKHLEREGLVIARSYSTRPPRFAYSLTAAGRDLAGALALLAAWGAAHTDDVQPPAHALCGTPLEARWFCPTCTATVTDPDADELRYA